MGIDYSLGENRGKLLKTKKQTPKKLAGFITECVLNTVNRELFGKLAKAGVLWWLVILDCSAGVP